MLAKKTVVLVLLLFLTVAFSTPINIPRVHGAVPTGEVCLADSTSGIGSATPCPATVPVFAGPKGQQIRIGVFIQGSYNVTGFDVVILTDHTYLVPKDVDLTGTVLPGAPLVALECLQGVLKIGNVCASVDSVDTLHFTVSAGLGLHTTSPTTGLLFTAIYNMTGITAAGGISVGYQTGCTGTSVAGGFCVTIAGGAIVADPETAQAGTFNNSTPPPFVIVTASQSSFGPEFPGTNTATITATAGTGYPPFGATDSVSFIAVASSTSLSATLSGTNPCATGGAGLSCSVTLTLSAAAAGNYFVTVSGTYGTVDALGNPDTLVGTVRLSVVVYDFGISVSPTTFSFVSGLTGTATITLTSLNGFAGAIVLSTSINSPTTPPLTITYNPSTVTLAGQTLTSTATFSASPTAATTYHVQVKATSGTRAKLSAFLLVQVIVQPDFSIIANPGSVPVTVGVAGNSTISVTGVNSFTGTVSLAVSTNSTNLGCLTPASITGGSGTSKLSCTSGVAGNYLATVTGTSGSLSHSTTVTYNVQDFTIAASPSTVSTNPNVAATATINVGAVNGFTGKVTLAVSTNSTSLSCTVIPSGIVGGFGSSTLSCSSPTVANYSATVTGTNGTLSHSVSVVFRVTTDFTITPSPASLTVIAGALGNSTITIAPLYGFVGTVTLTVATNSTNLACVLTASSIDGGSGTSTLSCKGSQSGVYRATVTGSSAATPSHSANVTYQVEDFALTASPASVTVSAGSAGASTISVASLNGFASPVGLSVVNTSCSVTPASVTGSGSAILSCTFASAQITAVVVNGTSGHLSHLVTVTFNVTAITFGNCGTGCPAAVLSDATVTNFSGNTIQLNFTVSGKIGTTAFANVTIPKSAVPDISNLQVTLNGTPVSPNPIINSNSTAYFIYFTFTFQSSFAVQVLLIPPNFSISASPTSIAIAGAAGTSTITIAPVNGLTGTVGLTDVSSPAGLSCTLTPANIVLGASQTSTLSCSSATANVYTVTVTATSGSLSHSTTVTVTAKDFSLTANPTTVTTTAGTPASSTITLVPLQGFTGTVSLTWSVTGLTCALSATSIVLGASQTSTLTCSSTSAATYAVTVTGTSGSLSHSVTVNYAITDFALKISAYTITVTENQTSYVSVNAVSVNGFAGTVTLALTVKTNIPTALQPVLTLDQYTVTLAPNDVRVVTLTIAVGSRAVPNSYAVNVTGTSGMLSDYKTIILTVPRPDFAITVNPPADALPVIITPGGTGITGLTLAGLYGFNGSVTLSVALSPASGLSCSLDKTTVILVPGKTNSTILSCHGSAGGYSVTVTGTAVELYDNGFSNTAHVGYTVVDFTIATTPNGILVNTGQQGHAAINVTWAHGYTGIVELTLVPSAGLSASIDPSRLSGSGVATLTISSNVAGVYSVVVNGTGGGTSHTATVTVTVTAVALAANILGLDPTVFYSLVGVLAVAVIAGLVALSRRGKK